MSTPAVGVAIRRVCLVCVTIDMYEKIPEEGTGFSRLAHTTGMGDSDIEPMINRSTGEHANHYAIIGYSGIARAFATWGIP